jgi:putative oxidoreductase
VSASGGLTVYRKALSNGDMAVALLNETASTATISTSASAIAMPGGSSYRLKDLWSKATRSTSGSISASVPAHGTVVYRVTRSGGTPPVAGARQLSDLTSLSSTNGWGPIEKDRSVNTRTAGDGRTLTIGGTTGSQGPPAGAPKAAATTCADGCTATSRVPARRTRWEVRIMILRKVARPLLAVAFVFGGLSTLRNPKPPTELAKPVLNDPTDPEPLVKLDALVKVTAGLALGLGTAPRLAALLLAGNLLPAMAVQRFWEQEDPRERAAQQARFLGNLGLLGGLLLAAADTHGKPSVAWRAKRVAREAGDRVQDAVGAVPDAVRSVLPG